MHGYNTIIRFIDVTVYKPFFMKCILLFASVVLFSCNIDSQNSNEPGSKDSIAGETKPFEYTSFDIKEIEDIPEGVNERSPEFIKKRLELLIGDSYKNKCEAIGIAYPPKFVLFRAFKLEKEFEIWVADKRSDTLHLLATLPICAVDAEPGPKLKQGDGKTPEGFYTCNILYGSPNSFMWIKLNSKEIDTYGSVGYGSSFKLCLEYPLAIDANRTKIYSSGHNPGSAICIHGNCVTAGCISFENENFLPIFLSARYHDTNQYGFPKIHIFPFRFSDELKKKYSEEIVSDMGKEKLLLFWSEIQKAYDLFNTDKKAIRVTYSNNAYHFTEY